MSAVSESMIERICRTLAREEYAEAFVRPEALQEFIDSEWGGYTPMARAVLAAMREPTDGQTEHGQAALDYTPIKDCEQQAKQVWGAMIDAALEGK